MQNAELNQPNAELNDLANQAAMDAANAQAAGGSQCCQQQSVEQRECGGREQSTNPTEAEEQNVSGM